MMHLLRLFTTVGLLGLAVMTTPAHAAEGELGQWLRAEALPSLAETLTRHPRFRGETLEIGPLQDGAPARYGTRLTRELERDIRQALLDVPGIRLRPRQGTATVCSSADGIYLGIAVRALHGNRFEVALRFLDRVENLWITGSGALWEGPLTTGQRQAWAQAEAAPGDMIPPLDDTRAVSARLLAELDCLEQRAQRLPELPWRLEPPEDAHLNAVAADLQRRAPGRFTPDADATPLRLAVDPDGRHVSLIGPHAALASVAVRNAAAPLPAVPPGMTAEPAAPAPLGMLAVDAQAVAPTGICTRTRGGRCLEASVQADMPAWSWVFVTFERNGQHRVQLVDCNANATTARTTRTLRFALARDIDDAPVGVYALATGSPAMAMHVARAFTGACERPADPRWIDELDQLASHPEVTWQAHQVSDDETSAWAAADGRRY